MNVVNCKAKSNPINEERTLGLAFSGGGARGLAHIGVLKAFHDSKINIHCIAGTSIGAVIAAGYAAGYTPDELQQIAIDMSNTRQLIHLADPTLPRSGLFQGDRLHDYFDRLLQGKTFDDLSIPVTMIAVDLNAGEEVYLNQGRVADALRATISIPGLMAPYFMDDKRLVDGGLLNNLPVDVVRKMGADVVMGVDTTMNYHDNSNWKALAHSRFIPSAMEDLVINLGASLNLIVGLQQRYKLEKYPPDFLLRPEVPSGVTTLTGFKRVQEIVTAGEKSAVKILPALQEKLSSIEANKN